MRAVVAPPVLSWSLFLKIVMVFRQTKIDVDKNCSKTFSTRTSKWSKFQSARINRDYFQLKAETITNMLFLIVSSEQTLSMRCCHLKNVTRDAGTKLG